MDRTRMEGRKLVAAQPSGESHSDTGETHSQAPTPLLPPVLDHFQYANTRAKV